MMASARESAPREQQEMFFGALAHLREEVDERGVEQGWIAGLLAMALTRRSRTVSTWTTGS